uniref:Uncharacterized protein n=1 Tax=Meloidogyne javanica TaxID=6303 RepID=A0A915LHC9_MELJA
MFNHKHSLSFKGNGRPYDKAKFCAILWLKNLEKEKNNQVVLSKCFVNINDECLELHASVQDICINTNFVLCPFDKPLKTPVKRKSEEFETIELDIKSQKK